jgi:hypothetical protein
MDGATIHIVSHGSPSCSSVAGHDLAKIAQHLSVTHIGNGAQDILSIGSSYRRPHVACVKGLV